MFTFLQVFLWTLLQCVPTLGIVSTYFCTARQGPKLVFIMSHKNGIGNFGNHFKITLVISYFIIACNKHFIATSFMTVHPKWITGKITCQLLYINLKFMARCPQKRIRLQFIVDSFSPHLLPHPRNSIKISPRCYLTMLMSWWIFLRINKYGKEIFYYLNLLEKYIHTNLREMQKTSSTDICERNCECNSILFTYICVCVKSGHMEGYLAEYGTNLISIVINKVSSFPWNSRNWLTIRLRLFKIIISEHG